MTESEVLIVPFEKIKEMMNLDVSHLSETRLGLTYLPWAEAELLLREHFPTFKVVCEITDIYRDAIIYAAIKAQIVDVATGKRTLEEYFPVMGNDKQRLAKPNPTTRDIADSIKRASVKVIARETGIGLSLYRKEKDDLPPENFQSTRLETTEETASAPAKRSFKLR